MDKTRAQQLREQHPTKPTQLDVSIATGVHPSLISKLENGSGRPGTDGLLALARFYDTTIEDLLGEEVPA